VTTEVRNNINIVCASDKNNIVHHIAPEAETAKPYCTIRLATANRSPISIRVTKTFGQGTGRGQPCKTHVNIVEYNNTKSIHNRKRYAMNTPNTQENPRKINRR